MKKNVLVFPCGSEIGLEVHRSLKYVKDFDLYGASSVDDHGKFVYERYISGVPQVEDDGFIQRLELIIKKYDIDFVIPAHDSVVVKLAQNREALSATIITSSAETCEIARSKRKTYELLEGIIRTPRIFDDGDELQFPVFLKPEVGQGSKGTFKADNKDDLDYALRLNSTLMILEYLPGDEYTVDCFTDKEGALLFAQPRTRSRVSNGISVNSTLTYGEEFQVIARKINEVLQFRGVWFFQVKRNADGELVLLEIAPRVAGTMALSRMLGVNLPLLSLYDAGDTPVQILKNNFSLTIDRALDTKFALDISYTNVYIDFDDTIVLDEKPNFLNPYSNPTASLTSKTGIPLLLSTSFLSANESSINIESGSI